MVKPGVFPRHDSLDGHPRISHGRIFPFDLLPHSGGIPAADLSNQTDQVGYQVYDAVAFGPEKPARLLKQY